MLQGFSFNSMKKSIFKTLIIFERLENSNFHFVIFVYGDGLLFRFSSIILQIELFQSFRQNMTQLALNFFKIFESKTFFDNFLILSSYSFFLWADNVRQRSALFSRVAVCYQYFFNSHCSLFQLLVIGNCLFHKQISFSPNMPYYKTLCGFLSILHCHILSLFLASNLSHWIFY